MKKIKLKPFVIPSISVFLLITAITAVLLNLPETNNFSKNITNIDYVTKTILDDEVAVINTTTTIINPYTDQSVVIGKYFYDYKADATKQEKSIIYHDDTYMQNSGIDFISENTFDIVAVLSGTVSNVSENETLGKIIEINHDNGYVTIYQSLSEVNVKKGDTVSQGQVIGKSGTNELDKEIGNHLHFEFYANGQVVDPTFYLNKELSQIKSKE
ncbi:MAG: M23 family metallopeptidase [bacterium]|nr:M23 family metallopeptidase [bacterium]